ncbi:MAG: hypothetical protein HXM45_11115, partial [Lautropia mirabilis]|nr:hypothetical protein [Lautropia mirabilis]
MKPPSSPPSAPGASSQAPQTADRREARAVDLESALALDRPPPRWHMLPAFGGVLLLHAALLYGISITDDVLQAASGDDQPVYVELVNAPQQQPVIPEPTAPPPPPP